MTFDTNALETTPVVCVGFSGGGIRPLQDFFRDLRPDTGMAFVILPYLPAHNPTVLPLLLSLWTTMLVELVSQGMSLRPNYVYVVPSGNEVTMEGNVFRLRSRDTDHKWSKVVSRFLASLIGSSHQGVAVLLSEMDAHGGMAVEAFRRHGGICIAQSSRTAENSDTPDAAIGTAFIDYALPLRSISEKLHTIVLELRAAKKGHTISLSQA